MKFELLSVLIIKSMNTDFAAINQLYISLGYCMFLLVLAIVFRKFPPKKINGIYGYRTPSSMLNQDTWDAANTYWISLFMKICVLNFLFPLLGYFIFPEYTFLITVIVTSIALIVTIPFTEIFLKKNFDQDGNRV